jgi:hypothetical protein
MKKKADWILSRREKEGRGGAYNLSALVISLSGSETGMMTVVVD